VFAAQLQLASSRRRENVRAFAARAQRHPHSKKVQLTVLHDITAQSQRPATAIEDFESARRFACVGGWPKYLSFTILLKTACSNASLTNR
jgi:hypothetical protein